MTAGLAAVAVALAVLVLGPGDRAVARRRLADIAAGPARVTPAGGATRLAGAAGAAGVVGLAAVAGVAWPLAIVAAAAVPALPAVLARRRHRRLAAARSAETVEVVTALAAELRAGRPPGSALAAVADATRHLRDPLATAAAAVAHGAAADRELARVAALPGCAAFRSVAAAWSVTDRVGGPVADVLERVAAGLDAQRAHRTALDAALAGPRTTMLVLAGLPALGILLGTSMGAAPLDLLLHRPLGWGLAAGAAVLDGAGVLWVRRITRGATR